MVVAKAELPTSYAHHDSTFFSSLRKYDSMQCSLSAGYMVSGHNSIIPRLHVARASDRALSGCVKCYNQMHEFGRIGMVYSRPDWDVYFMMMAGVAATRSTCLRRRVGAVIVRGRQVVSTGYNGSPRGLPHCAEVGCLREILSIPSGERHEMCRGSHAEMNAISQAAATGVSTEGGHIYCTHEPCSYCTKAIINAGIVRLVFLHPYPDELAREMRSQASLSVSSVSVDLLATAGALLESIILPDAQSRREN